MVPNPVAGALRAVPGVAPKPPEANPAAFVGAEPKPAVVVFAAGVAKLPAPKEPNPDIVVGLRKLCVTVVRNDPLRLLNDCRRMHGDGVELEAPCLLHGTWYSTSVYCTVAHCRSGGTEVQY